MEQISSYKLLQRVGEGSFGEVWRAEKEGRPYALKLFKKGSPPEVLQEGKILQQLNHPNLIRFVEENLEGPEPFLVTEWVEGPFLEDQACPSDFPTLVKVTAQILKGLQAIHQKGYVHGDLKGHHIVLGPEGVKLLDLGLARRLTVPENSTATGTLAYLAPEIFFGKNLSPQSDFYALGMVLYRWLNGAYPFQSATVPSAIRWHLFEQVLHPVPRHSEIPLEFGDLILKLLSKNPKDRPYHAQQALQDLSEHFGLDRAEIPPKTAGEGEEEGEGFELHGEAIRFYEGKESLTAEEDLILAELHYLQGHLPRSLEILHRLDSPQAHILMTKVLTRMGRFEEAKGWIPTVTPRMKELSLKDSLSFLNAQGVLDFYLGRVGDSLASFASAEELARGSGERAALASVYNNLANGLLEKGELPLAEKYFLRSLDLAQESGDRIHEGMFQMSLGYFFHRLNRYAEALSAYNESLKILEKVGQKSERARVLLNRANLFLKLGGLSEATRDLTEAQEIFRARSLDYLLAYSLLIEGEILQKRKRWREALQYFRKAEQELSSLGRSSDVFYCLLHQIENDLEVGENEESRSLLDRLAREPAVLEQDSLAGHFHLLKARWQMATGDTAEKISKELQQSKLLLKKVKDPEALIFLHFTWGRFLEGQNQKAEAGNHFLESKRQLEKWIEEIPIEWRVSYQQYSCAQDLEKVLGEESFERSEEVIPPMERTKFSLQEKPSAPFAFQSFFEKEMVKLLEELVGELNLSLLVEKILDRTIALTGAERGFILLKEKKTPRIAASRNLDRETLQEVQSQISGSIASEVLKSGEPMIAVDALIDERFSLTASVHQLKLRSILCLPFKRENEILGALYLDDRRQGGTFSSGLTRTLSPFTELMAQVLTNAHRFGEVRNHLEMTRKKLEAAEGELKKKYEYRSLVGRHLKMQEVFQVIDRVAEVEVPVMILGESGVGKELVAKAIHYHGPRADHPFISLNCEAIPEGLFESELFGHARGAFTGAISDRTGLLEAAQHGTLFLDEIGDMPLSLQGKLLRVIQEGTFRPVGHKEEKTADCRILAATHRDLRSLIAEGKFREDLWFRLNVVEIEIPPLRERKEDLPLIVDHFLEEFSRRHGRKKMRIPPEAMALLSDYSWPGNVRELENTLSNACVFALGDVIDLEAFRYKRELWGGGAQKPEAGGQKPEAGSQRPEVRGQKELSEKEIPVSGLQPPVSLQSFRQAKQEFEKNLITTVLREAQGNITRAALQLNIARPQLSRMIKRYQIHL